MNQNEIGMWGEHWKNGWEIRTVLSLMREVSFVVKNTCNEKVWSTNCVCSSRDLIMGLLVTAVHCKRKSWTCFKRRNEEPGLSALSVLRRTQERNLSYFKGLRFFWNPIGPLTVDVYVHFSDCSNSADIVIKRRWSYKEVKEMYLALYQHLLQPQASLTCHHSNGTYSLSYNQLTTSLVDGERGGKKRDVFELQWSWSGGMWFHVGSFIDLRGRKFHKLHQSRRNARMFSPSPSI